MRRPSFQFYPADWTGNGNLKRCSHKLKGVWMDVLCLLHDSENEYGILRWPLREIAQAAGCKLSDLQELIDKSVLKGADPGQACAPLIYIPRSGRKDGEPVTLIAAQQGPIWYSSRMVRDEHVRTIRGESSRFEEGGKPPPKAKGKGSPKAAPKPPFGDGSSASTSSSASRKNSSAGASPATAGDEGLTTATWEAYVAAWMHRYPKADQPPQRNAQIGGQLAKFVKNVGADLAPKLAEFYVSLPMHARNLHPIGELVQNYEGIRARYLTGDRGLPAPSGPAPFGSHRASRTASVMSAAAQHMNPARQGDDLEDAHGPLRITG